MDWFGLKDTSVNRATNQRYHTIQGTPLICQLLKGDFATTQFGSYDTVYEKYFTCASRDEMRTLYMFSFPGKTTAVSNSHRHNDRTWSACPQRGTLEILPETKLETGNETNTRCSDTTVINSPTKHNSNLGRQWMPLYVETRHFFYTRPAFRHL